MASFTGVGDNVVVNVRDRDTPVDVAISGTYSMQIDLQKEVGSPGSGVWQTIPSFTWTSVNATTAARYYTKDWNERLRLIVMVDTSGTAVSTLTVDPNPVQVFTDKNGTVLVDYYATGAVPNFAPVVLNASTYVLNRADHANRKLILALSGGIDIDLPAATGSGDTYEFFVGVLTADAYELNAHDAGVSDIQGVICGVDDGTEFTWGAATGNNTVTLGGTSQATGGTVGDWVKLTDIFTGVYSVQGLIHQGGTQATPFSTDT